MITINYNACIPVFNVKYFDYSVSAEMLLRMMQTNPTLAEKMIQNDRGDEESMDHLKSDKTFALI